MSDEIKPRQCHECGLVFGYNQGHICLDLKPKRTISLEAYIKMQCDVALKNTSHAETILSLAKKSVDKLLKHNNVEVEE